MDYLVNNRYSTTPPGFTRSGFENNPLPYIILSFPLPIVQTCISLSSETASLAPAPRLKSETDIAPKISGSRSSAKNPTTFSPAQPSCTPTWTASPENTSNPSSEKSTTDRPSNASENASSTS